jgi:hypothetical protein
VEPDPREAFLDSRDVRLQCEIIAPASGNISARRHEFRARLNFARTPEPALKRWSESRKELSAAAELLLVGPGYAADGKPNIPAL